MINNANLAVRGTSQCLVCIQVIHELTQDHSPKNDVLLVKMSTS